MALHHMLGETLSVDALVGSGVDKAVDNRDVHRLILEAANADEDNIIREVMHAHLFEAGITTLHRSRTGGKSIVLGGISNNVVTAYVEHIFIAWLAMKMCGVRTDTVPDDTPCQSPDVSARDFHPEDYIDIDALAEVNDDAAFVEMLGSMMDDYRAAKERAKAVCGTCPVSLQCLTRSVILGDGFGVWGGMDSGERHLIMNRFRNMRYAYLGDTMPTNMRRDFEEHARQIARSISRAARLRREQHTDEPAAIGA